MIDFAERWHQGEEYSRARQCINAIRKIAFNNHIATIPGAMSLHRSKFAFEIERIQGSPASFHPAWTSPAIYANTWMRK